MSAFIKHISVYIPDNKLSNELLAEQFPEWTADKVFSKLGVTERGIAADDEFVSDMAIKATNQLCKDYYFNLDKVDFILLCTQSPDYFLPTTACIVQHKLGLRKNIGALDFNLGCSGYVYGLSLAKGLIVSKAAKNVLLITSETYSRYIHKDDKSNKAIFGDGATATIISDEGELLIKDFIFGTDGAGAENLIVKNGALRYKKGLNADYQDSDGNIRNDANLYMNGPEVFNFTLRSVPELVKNTLQINGLGQADIDHFVFHQANKFMLDNLRKKIGVEKEKFHIFMDRTGNTVSSTLPIALAELINRSKIDTAQKILLAGFGVGYSWAGCVIENTV